MRAVMCGVGFALVLTTACGGEADTAAGAESSAASDVSIADSIVEDLTADVTAVVDTEEGGSKDDVTPAPAVDDVDSEDALVPFDDDTSASEGDTDIPPQDAVLPESDVEAHDTDTTQHELDAASDAGAEAEDSGSLVDVSPAEDTAVIADDVTEADAAAVADITGDEDTGSEADVGEDVEVEPDPCEACIASGGTWQPEANACTQSCDIMDISCYTSECPAPCSPASCGTCIGQQECEDAGCQWNAQPPAFWCN